MNSDILRYKTNFLTLVLILGFSFMHLVLTGAYSEATPERLLHFSASLPFSQRLLMPTIANLVSKILPLPALSLFFILDILVAGLLLRGLRTLINQFFPLKMATLLAWVFFLLLPLVYVVNYRFSVGGAATFYYPYDLATLLFMVWGLLWCLQERWGAYFILLFAATINRESAILLVFLIPALHYHRFNKRYALLTLGAFTVFLLTHLGVLLFANHHQGTWVEIIHQRSQLTHFYFNIMWLFKDLDWTMLFFGMAGLPLFWFAFYDYIPQQFRPLRYLCLLYFIGLSVVGNLQETRIFGEIVVLLYLPVCLGLQAWLQNKPEVLMVRRGFIYWLDRYIILSSLAALVLFYYPLNQWIIQGLLPWIQ